MAISMLTGATALLAAVLAVLTAVAPANAAFDLNSKTNVVVYYGQGPYQRDLLYYCRQISIDAIILSFINRFPAQGNGYIGTNFGNQCSGTVYSGPGSDHSSDFLLSDCNGAGMSEAIKTCQDTHGKTILLSLGGDSLAYQLTGAQEGQDMADQLWEMFGPLQFGYSGPRPFDGSWGSVEVDGFDFNIERPPTDGGEGYIALAQRLRYYFDTAASVVPAKTWYLTASPQCVVPDVNMGAMMEAQRFDALFIQFFNTPFCSAAEWVAANSDFAAGAEAVESGFTYDTWSAWVAGSASAGAPIFIGLPGAEWSAGAGSYLTPTEMEKLVMAYFCRGDFGGIMVWDATSGYENVVGGRTYYQNVKRGLGKAYNEPAAKACYGEEVVLPVSEDGRCGLLPFTATETGTRCGEEMCCSMWGWCGSGFRHCGWGCQSPGFGECWS